MYRRLILSASVCLLAALGASCSSSKPSDIATGGSTVPGTGAAEIHEIEVTISDAGCEPRQIAATAGPTTFKVTNDGSTAVTEFEVLDRRHHPR